jgi:hypothetical protein
MRFMLVASIATLLWFVIAFPGDAEAYRFTRAGAHSFSSLHAGKSSLRESRRPTSDVVPAKKKNRSANSIHERAVKNARARVGNASAERHSIPPMPMLEAILAEHHVLMKQDDAAIAAITAVNAALGQQEVVYYLPVEKTLKQFEAFIDSGADTTSLFAILGEARRAQHSHVLLTIPDPPRADLDREIGHLLPKPE